MYSRLVSLLEHGAVRRRGLVVRLTHTWWCVCPQYGHLIRTCGAMSLVPGISCPRTTGISSLSSAMGAPVDNQAAHGPSRLAGAERPAELDCTLQGFSCPYGAGRPVGLGADLPSTEPQRQSASCILLMNDVHDARHRGVVDLGQKRPVQSSSLRLANGVIASPREITMPDQAPAILLTAYREHMREAALRVAEIEAGMVTYHEARESRPMKDVTDEFRIELTRHVAVLARMIHLMETGPG